MPEFTEPDYYKDPDTYFTEVYNITAESKPTITTCWYCKKLFKLKNTLVNSIPTRNAYTIKVIKSNYYL